MSPKDAGVTTDVSRQEVSESLFHVRACPRVLGIGSGLWMVATAEVRKWWENRKNILVDAYDLTMWLALLWSDLKGRWERSASWGQPAYQRKGTASRHPNTLSSALRLSKALAHCYSAGAFHADLVHNHTASTLGSVLVFLYWNRWFRSFLKFRITQLSTFWILTAESFQIQSRMRT